MDKFEMFRRQIMLQSEMRGEVVVDSLVLQDEVDAILSTDIQTKRREGHRVAWAPDLSPYAQIKEPRYLIAEYRNEFQSAKTARMLLAAKKDLLSPLVGSLGLGKVLAIYDRTGGSVDTINNVKEGIYASERERGRYENRGSYESSKIYSDEAFKKQNKDASEAKKSNSLIDEYTNEQLKYNDLVDTDHKVSNKDNHDDPARVLAELEQAEVSNMAVNMAVTHRSINRSKGRKSLSEFADWLDNKAADRKNRIVSLQQKSSLSQKEVNELEKLVQQDKIDTNRLRKLGKDAQREIDEKNSNAYYSSEKFRRSVVIGAANEGAKLGSQQAIGELLVEFIAGAFDEIADLYKHGYQGRGVIREASFRLKRLSKRILSKWKNVLNAGAFGFITGLVSGLVTTLINVFRTTGRRVIRLLREGVASMIRALKVVIFRPKGTTYAQGLHEASKILFAGGIVVAGIALEEVVDKLVTSVPILTPIAPILSSVLVGLITALAISMAFYLIDKADVFGALEQESDDYVINALCGGSKNTIGECYRLMSEIEEILNVRSPSKIEVK